MKIPSAFELKRSSRVAALQASAIDALMLYQINPSHTSKLLLIVAIVELGRAIEAENKGEAEKNESN